MVMVQMKGSMLSSMTPVTAPTLQFKSSGLFGTHSNSISFLSMPITNSFTKAMVIEARANAKKDSAKIRNRKLQRKFNGSPTKPRLSVFCSAKQLYAMLVDDQNKRCLFYGSTLQKSIHGNNPCSAIEAAERVGEELVKACIDHQINEISSYDRNGFARGERMQAFEIAISRHGFLPR
ncbi:50S ribosomal protein L18 [Vitis riparia]|uniref:50S ribosomal protein L18 n=1 Tax=Vitis riparia TaxID=96939 RepID=UPI00155A5B3F|nr:50S ribosomal protein L18 [Vitis riparia]XP_034702373.1 50S ribosomal protein L18 [Vitis riparia]